MPKLSATGLLTHKAVSGERVEAESLLVQLPSVHHIYLCIYQQIYLDIWKDPGE